MKKINLINKNGITLIALVITIIVLLVLAGTSISMLTGENGILNKVMQAKEENKKASIEEKIKIAVIGSIENTGNIEYEALRDNLNEINNIIGVPDNINDDSFPIVVQIEDSYIKITKDGEVKRTQIPLKYKEVEYIESTGTQGINTLFVPNNNTSIEIKASIRTFDSTERCLIGSWNLTPYSVRMLSDGYSYYYGSSVETTHSISSPDTNIHIIKTNKNILLVDDVVQQTRTINEFVSEVPLVLFGQRGISVYSRQISARMYYAKIWNDNTLVRNMIPCYNKETNEIGMYDTVNDTFYTNQGTGTFLKGNDI